MTGKDRMTDPTPPKVVKTLKEARAIQAQNEQRLRDAIKRDEQR
jgi:hypothetical protein